MVSPDESACSSTSAADERDALLPAAPAAAARRRRRAPWRALALALSAGLCVGAARGAARWRPSRVAAAELGAARWSRHAGAAYSYAYDDDGAAREVNRSRGGDTLTDDITDDFYSFSYQSPQLGVFKRTYWSIDPFRDAKFLETFVGLKVSASQVWKMPADPFDVAATTDKDDEPYPDFDASPKHGANGTQLCAHRSVVSSLEKFELHFFQSFVTPTGEIDTGTWTNSWSGLHGKMSSEDYEWDVFAYPTVTFYAEWIMPFVERLDQHNVDYYAFQCVASERPSRARGRARARPRARSRNTIGH